MSLWWLSFADPHRPKGTQFLGAVIVEAPDVMAAHAVSHYLGLNPGGEVQLFEIPEYFEDLAEPYMNKLMDREAITAMELEIAGDPPAREA